MVRFYQSIFLWWFKGIVHLKMTIMSSLCRSKILAEFLLLWNMKILWAVSVFVHTIEVNGQKTVWLPHYLPKYFLKCVTNISLLSCSAQCRLVTTWGWVNYDRIVILGVNYPFNKHFNCWQELKDFSSMTSKFTSIFLHYFLYILYMFISQVWIV